MIKVLIVDDSILMRNILTDILDTDKEIEVVGTAENGKEALNKIPILKPDVVTLDVEMPVMDGITTLEKIMKRFKIPVIMLSNLTISGADLTLKALNMGSVDFITKPKNIFSIGGEKEKGKIINTVKIASKSNVKRYNTTKKSTVPIVKHESIKSSTSKYNHLVAIGTSTGGPKALQEVIPKLPGDIDASILVVQHMPKGFTKSLAERLNNISHLSVKEGEDSEKIKRGYCYIAPGDYHMTVEEKDGELFIKLDKTPPILGLRPSVDIMMESLYEFKEINKIGVILTGMGSDGAKGICAISDSNGYTIAQDKKTSVVYGMPKSAIATGKIDKILPLQNIADEIIRKVEV